MRDRCGIGCADTLLDMSRLRPIDPGGFRVGTALRALGTAVIAVMITVSVMSALDAETARPAVIAGMLTTFLSPVTAPWGPGARRLGGCFALIPVVVMLSLGAFVPDHLAFAIIAMATIAYLAVWAGRFGHRAAAFGQVSFIVFFFSTLMGDSLRTLPAFLIAGSISVAVSVILGLIPEIAVRRRVYFYGVAGIHSRSTAFVATVMREAGEGRFDRRTLRRVTAQARVIRSTGSALAGRLDIIQPRHGLTPAEAARLRLCAADVELAVSAVASEYPLVHTGGFISLARPLNDLELALQRIDDEAARALAFPGTENETGDAPGTGHRGPEVGEAAEAGAAGSTVIAAAAASSTAAAAAEVHAPAVAIAGPVGLPASRKAVQSGLATGLSLLVGTLVSTTYQFWAVMPAYQVLQSSGGETRANAAQKVLMTLVGAVVAFSAAVALSHAIWADLLLLGVCVFYMGYVRGVAPAWHAFWSTAQFALMYDALGKLHVETVVLRVTETAIGAAVAAVVAILVLPLLTRQRLHSGIEAALDTVEATVRHSLRHGLRGGDFAPDSGSGSASDLEQLPDAEAMIKAVTQVEKIAVSIRRDPGSLRRNGIESQITLLWALAADARQLAEASAASASPPPDVAAAISAALEQGFSAARSACATDRRGRRDQRDHAPRDEAGVEASPVLDGRSAGSANAAGPSHAPSSLGVRVEDIPVDPDTPLTIADQQLIDSARRIALELHHLTQMFRG